MANKPLILWALSREEGKGKGQCDCACSDIILSAQETAISELSEASLVIGEGVRIFHLSNDWYFGFKPGSTVVPVVINAEAKTLLDNFRLPNTVRNATRKFEETGLESVDRLVKSGLLSNVDDNHILSQDTSKTLTAWLHVTENCNLDCTYCYLPKSNTTMSVETGQSSIDAILKAAVQYGYKKVKIKYAGGEPTIYLPLISKFHKYALEKASRLNISLDTVILSNGVLLSESKLALIKQLGLRLMISLDGIGSGHNVQRKFRNGEGCFNIVAKNIDTALELGIAPEISITVTAQNMWHLPQMIEYVLSRQLPFTINFYRENDRSSKFENLLFEDEELIVALQAAYDVIEKYMPEQSLLNSIIDRASFNLPHTRVCAVGYDYMVISAKGLVSKCQMDMNSTVASIYDDDPLKLIREDQRGIQNLTVHEKNDCKDCEWKYWCAGGCPLSTYRLTGKFDAKSPNCEIYKKLFPEILKLESIRILRNYTAA